MEQNTIQWLRSPSCQRGSYAFYKSVSCRARPDGPLQVWRLGEFYYIRRGPQEPVCIAEVTLLWEEQGQHPLLASSRLYFLPEDTPKGRTRQHGEDEVLAVCKRMVFPVGDLVRWACPEPGVWRDQKRPGRGPSPAADPPREDQGGGTPPDPAGGTTAEPTSSPTPEPSGGTGAEPSSRTSGDECNAVTPQGVKVLSYPQYCRFRSLQRRLQDRGGLLGGGDPRLVALGGLRVALSNTRVMFCRETFSHPSLDAGSALWPHFRCPSLSLRGRPRKVKQRGAKETPTLTRSQSESWIDKMKENMMGSVDTSPERSWLPHPEEQLFLDQLFVFMERFGRPINKVPNLGFKKIDLFRMYSVVQGMGGYEKVTSERLWKVVYNDLGGCPGSTSAATCTRRHYERLMLGYEEHVRAGGAGLKLPESPAPTKLKAVRGRKAQPRGRKPGAKSKESAEQPAKAPAANPDGTAAAAAVVKRGRGRPPGRRNKATLLAQAKLLAQQQAKAKAASPPCSSSSSSTPPPGTPAPTPAPTPPPAAPHTVQSPSPYQVQSPSPYQVQSPSPYQVQSPSPKPALQAHPAHMPLTPDLSPLTAPLLPFLTKPGSQWAADPPGGGVTATPLSLGAGGGGGGGSSPLPSSPPGQPLILGTFSPQKGVCPLDAIRTRLSLHRVAEDPALHKPAVESCPQHTHQQHHHHHQHQHHQHHHQQHHQQPCSGCVAEEGAQRGGGGGGGGGGPPPKEGKAARPPLPPLRVFPLDLDCSVQVRQLMRTPLGSVQLQSFTRRLSEVLAQDLRAKPLPHACSPITPPPEQAQPLNLSQGPPAPAAAAGGGKRPAPLSLETPAAKRPALGDPPLGRAGGDGGGPPPPGPEGRPLPPGAPEPGAQEEPADLSSPSRIRAFLMGLPPFDLDPAGPATSLPVPPPGDKKEEEEEEEEEPMEGVVGGGGGGGGGEGPQRPTAAEEDEDEEGSPDVGSGVTDASPPLVGDEDDEEVGEEEEVGEGENSVSLSSAERDGSRSTGGQEVAEDKEEVRCEDFPAQGLPRTLLPAVVSQNS